MKRQEAFFFIDSPIPKRLDKQVLEGDDLGYLLRRTQVENAIRRGIAQDGFEVYYQPVYELNTKKLYGAEALLRLYDKELGQIFPDEFIPVIEQMGLIDDVDKPSGENTATFTSNSGDECYYQANGTPWVIYLGPHYEIGTNYTGD